MSDRRRYGIAARFADGDALCDAGRHMIAHGYTRLEAYAPYPVDGLAAAIGSRPNRLAPAMLLGGLAGALGTLALEGWTAIVHYPIRVGGRPPASWAAFVPAALEIALLGAAAFGVIAMLRGAGLPRLHHPMFAVDGFEAASRNGFFLVVRADDPKFSPHRTSQALAALKPESCVEVPS